MCLRPAEDPVDVRQPAGDRTRLHQHGRARRRDRATEPRPDRPGRRRPAADLPRLLPGVLCGGTQPGRTRTRALRSRTRTLRNTLAVQSTRSRNCPAPSAAVAQSNHSFPSPTAHYEAARHQTTMRFHGLGQYWLAGWLHRLPCAFMALITSELAAGHGIEAREHAARRAAGHGGGQVGVQLVVPREAAGPGDRSWPRLRRVAVAAAAAAALQCALQCALCALLPAARRAFCAAALLHYCKRHCSGTFPCSLDGLQLQTCGPMADRLRTASTSSSAYSCNVGRPLDGRQGARAAAKMRGSHAPEDGGLFGHAAPPPQTAANL